MKLTFVLKSQDSVEVIFKTFWDIIEKFRTIDSEFKKSLNINYRNDNSGIYEISYYHSFENVIHTDIWESIAKIIQTKIELELFKTEPETELKPIKLFMSKDNGLRKYTYLVINEEDKIII